MHSAPHNKAATTHPKALATTSCSVGYCRSIDKPLCRQCGDDGGAHFIDDPKLQLWSVGNLRPLPNRMNDAHMYICPSCDNTWRHRGPRFSTHIPDVRTPHVQDDAEYLAYRRRFMANYDEADRLACRFPSELYTGKRTNNLYILQFVTPDSHPNIIQTLLQTFRVDAMKYFPQTHVVVATLYDTPHTVVAYNNFAAKMPRIKRGEKGLTARIDLFDPQWHARAQRPLHNAPTWHERTWLDHSIMTSGSIHVLPEYRGDRLAAALKQFQERAYPHNAIYSLFLTQADNTAMQRAGAQAGYFQTNLVPDVLPQFGDPGDYVKPLEPMPHSYYTPQHPALHE